jgi:hypothetical protein
VPVDYTVVYKWLKQATTQALPAEAVAEAEAPS